MRSKAETGETTLAMWLIAPAALIIAGVALYPIVDAISLSFHHIQLQFPELGRPFVWLENYLAVLQDRRFFHVDWVASAIIPRFVIFNWAFGPFGTLTLPHMYGALWITVVFTVVTVFWELVLGLGLALILNRPSRLQGFARSVALVPWAFTTVVSALMWKFLYDEQFGIVNGVLLALHLISKPVVWLGSTETALSCAIVADIWKTTPFMALLLLAGLQNIPKEVYEAGRIDGTTMLQAFQRITLPMLKPTILVALLFRTLDAFRVFDLIFVLTGGGPANSTETISYLTYLRLFRQFDFGTGSALAILTFLFVMGISYLYIKVLGAQVKA